MASKADATVRAFPVGVDLGPPKGIREGEAYLGESAVWWEAFSPKWLLFLSDKLYFLSHQAAC